MDGKLEKVNRMPEPEGVANFNDRVWVKITPEGERVWNEFYAKMKGIFDAAGTPVPKVERDADGWTQLQLHDVAHIFGSELYNGNPVSPVEMEFRTKDPSKKE